MILATEPVWAKKAASFPEECWLDETSLCQPVRIPSPNGQSSIEVRYRKKIIEEVEILQAYFLVTTPLKGVRKAAIPEGYKHVDLLWSPDSKAFFINGGNGGSYWGDWIYVYLLSDEHLRRHNITHQAQHDMAKDISCLQSCLSPARRLQKRGTTLRLPQRERH